MQFKDYYAELDVTPETSDADLKKAYRRLARKYHPDVSKEAGGEERFKAINEAYEVLRDPQKRRAYDQLRSRGYRPGEEFRPPPDFGEGYEFDLGDILARRRAAGGNAAEGGFSDFFESLFGQMRGGGFDPRARAGGAGGFERAARGGGDLRATLEVPLQVAFAGGMQRISVDGRTLDVKIPAGVQPGQVIRLAGQGQGIGGQRGDLLLEVAIQADPRFELSGRDVLHRLPVPPWRAALGGKVAVPTLAGTVELNIPAGSDSGRKLRLRGRGLPGNPAGDQIVELAVAAPAPSSEAQRAAYAALARAFGED